MRAHVFRGTNYAPAPVTALCADGTTIAVCRRNAAIELIDSASLRCFARRPLSKPAVQCTFLDSAHLLTLQDNGDAVILNTATLETSAHAISAVCAAASRAEHVCAEHTFFFATTRDEICKFTGTTATVLYRERARVTAMAVLHGRLAYTTTDGWLRVLAEEEGATKLVSEVDLRGVANAFCELPDGNVVAVTNTGAALLVDMQVGAVVDTAAVRKHALNAVVFQGGRVHMAGADSRVICFGADGALVRGFQTDMHSSEVLCMAVDGERVLTAGEDSLVVLHESGSARYCSRRLYDASLFSGVTDRHFYVCGQSSVEFFAIEEAQESGAAVQEGVGEGEVALAAAGKHCTAAPPQPGKRCVKRNNLYNDKITYKISESVLERINMPHTSYKHFLSMRLPEQPLALAVSTDERFVAFSTADKTQLMSLRRGEHLAVEPLTALPAALQLAFAGDRLVLLGPTRTVTVFSLTSFEVETQFEVESVREHIGIAGDGVVLLKAKEMRPFASLTTAQPVPIDGTVIAAAPVGSALHVAARQGENVALYRIASVDGTPSVKSCSDQSSAAQIHVAAAVEAPASGCAAPCVYSDSEYLYVQHGWGTDESARAARKYDLGALILGMLTLPESGDVVVLQNNWARLAMRFKPGAFKEKYSNK